VPRPRRRCDSVHPLQIDSVAVHNLGRPQGPQSSQRSGRFHTPATPRAALGTATTFCASTQQPVSFFCCQFNSLVDAAKRLTAASRPEVFIAEPVGSCTDLIAMVIYVANVVHRRVLGDVPARVLWLRQCVRGDHDGSSGWGVPGCDFLGGGDCHGHLPVRSLARGASESCCHWIVANGIEALILAQLNLGNGVVHLFSRMLEF
jgi:hypothetical protein